MNQARFHPVVIGISSWLIPGAGHWQLGHKRRGGILFVTIQLLFWTGIAIGGIAVVDPAGSLPWFLAQLGSGVSGIMASVSRSLLFGALHVSGEASLLQPAQFRAIFVDIPPRSLEVGRLYSGIAGLLNVLAVLDALSRGFYKAKSITTTQ